MTPSLIAVSKLKKNPSNPRIIKDDKFKKLVASIKQFPEMLKIRPIVYVGDFIVLGGNMRLEACKAAGLKEVWATDASELTPEQQNEFIIKDNVGYGEWDWDALANEWDTDDLTDWGLDISGFNSSEIDYSGKNQEIDTDFENQKYNFKLEYSEAEYSLLKERIASIGKTPEQIFYEAII